MKVRELRNEERKKYAKFKCVCGFFGAVLYWHDAVGEPVCCPKCNKNGLDLMIMPLESGDGELEICKGIARTL